MSMFSAIQGQLSKWVDTRTADLCSEWDAAIYVLTGFREDYWRDHEIDVRLDEPPANRRAPNGSHTCAANQFPMHTRHSPTC